MLTISTCFWRANRHSVPLSRCYEPHWVDRLAAGFRRNLTIPHQFIAFTDRDYEFGSGVEQFTTLGDEPDWSSMIAPFCLEGPMIVAGLDTVIVGSVDDLARYCFDADRIALPRSPGQAHACNGICLVPPGQTGIYNRWSGENDMLWLREQPHHFIDDLFPGQVLSYRLQARPNGFGDARVIYFHGRDKPHELTAEPFIQEHWRT